ALRPPARTSRHSSGGTTPNIVIPAWRGTHRTTSTMDMLRRYGPPALTPSTRRTPATPNDSSASHPSHPRSLPPCGSTSQHPKNLGDLLGRAVTDRTLVLGRRPEVAQRPSD